MTQYYPPVYTTPAPTPVKPMLQTWIIPLLLCVSILLNIFLAAWIVHSVNNYQQYCYYVGTTHYTSNTGTDNAFSEPVHVTCSDNPLPQSP